MWRCTRSVQVLTASTLIALLVLQLPGACAHLLHHTVVRLSSSTDTSLAAPRNAAAALLDGSQSEYSTAAAVAGGFLPARQVGSLGCLGEFLLGQWQQEAAHERALLARGRQLKPAGAAAQQAR